MFLLPTRSKAIGLSLILIMALVVCSWWTAGAKAWSDDPTVNTAICTASDAQYNPRIASDGSGGAIITWVDWRSGNGDIYARRVDSSGTPQWTADGVGICIASGYQDYPAIIGDGAAGAIITWRDLRSGNWDIYAQRVTADGLLPGATPPPPPPVGGTIVPIDKDGLAMPWIVAAAVVAVAVAAISLAILARKRIAQRTSAR